MNYDQLQALIAQDHGGVLEKVAEAAAQRATERIYAQHAQQAHTFQKISAQESLVRTAIEKVAHAANVAMLLESGQYHIKTAEEAAELDAILAEGEAAEEDLVELALEGEDNRDALEEAVIELAADSPELAAELLSAEGDDVDAAEVDALSDELAEQMLIEELGAEDEVEAAKVAHSRHIWGEWAKVSSPLAQTLMVNLAHRKASNAVLLHQMGR